MSRYKERGAPTLLFIPSGLKTIAEQYANLLLCQSQAVLRLVRGVCSLDNLLDELKSGKDSEKYDLMNYTCTPFGDFFVDWKASYQRKFKEPEPEPK
jgi:hypothetical protein